MSDNLVESYTKLNKKHQETLKENKQLKKRLAEKDQEIKKHIDALEYWENNIPNQRQEIKKQVCNKIREKLKAHCDYTDENNIGWYLTEHKIDILLDQIEQAKEK